MLVKKGRPGSATAFLSSMKTITERLSLFYGESDTYEERINPNYPEETYEAFISRMVKLKKLKIEKVLDLK